jgi:hypothetical protein
MVMLAVTTQAANTYNQSLLTAETDFLNSGIILDAINLGGGTLTINGITFAASLTALRRHTT